MSDVITRRDGLDLVLERTIEAPRAVVWRCWHEPELLMQWYCPKPWAVTETDLDQVPGGRMNMVFSGPDGEHMPLEGIYLHIEEGKRLVFTDAYREGWVPHAESFMTGQVSFEDTPDGATKMVWMARHKSAEEVEKHLTMGFEEGWPAAAEQLNELAKSVAEATAP